MATRKFKIIYGAPSCSSQIPIDGTALDSWLMDCLLVITLSCYVGVIVSVCVFVFP